MNYLKKFEDIKVPIEVGDTILGGRFKNKRLTIKKIGKNAKGDITVNNKPLLKYRIAKKANEEIIYNNMKYLKIYEEFNKFTKFKNDDLKTDDGRISMFDDKRFFELLPDELTIVHTKGDNYISNGSQIDKKGKVNTCTLKKSDIAIDPVKLEITYTQYTPEKEDGDVLADGEPDNLEFDVHVVKNNDGVESNPDNLKLNIDITYGDAIPSSFTIEAPNKVYPHDYTGEHSVVDPKTMFAFTHESLLKLSDFFNRFDDKFTTTPEDFKFLDTKSDSYVPSMDDKNKK